MNATRSLAWMMALLLCGWALPLHGESPSASEPPLPNIDSQTRGGGQHWGDVHVFHDWRIQRNCLTGHCRLLDGDDKRLAWGTEGDCRACLAELRRERELPPMQGRAVVLLHGLFSKRKAMASMAEYLRDQGNFTVVTVGYPSTRADIDAHATNLCQVIDGLEGVEEINFVAHSLGNLVIRRYLAVQSEAACGRQPDPRIKRIVMLAPPNQGTGVAEAFDGNRLFTLVAGPSAVQIARIRDSAPTLATPNYEFGILAGGRGNSWGYCPLLKGDDDGIVPVASTRLAGASDFAVLRALHCKIMDDQQAQECTLRFLERGYFHSVSQRQVIGENQ